MVESKVGIESSEKDGQRSRSLFVAAFDVEEDEGDGAEKEACAREEEVRVDGFHGVGCEAPI